MATKRRKSRKSGARKRSSSNIVVVSGRKRRSSRRSSVGATKKGKRRRSRVGATGLASMSSLKSIATVALGIGVGAGVSKFVIAPMGQKLAERWPMAAKFLAAGEIFLGGVVAMKGKSVAAKAVGIGIMASGVNKAIEQTNAYKALGIGAAGDGYSEIRIPMSGEFDQMIAGVINDGRRNVATNKIAGNLEFTNRIANTEVENTAWLAETELDNVMTYPIAKGVF